MRGEEEVKLAVKALTKTARQSNAKARIKSKAVEASINNVFELKLESEYAYLYLKTFDWRQVEKYDLKADDFYSDIFQKINDHGSSNLIVDLRGNTGGRKAFGEGIVPFIHVDKEVPFLIKNTSWKGKVKAVKKAKPSKNPFNGIIYVLVDGYTYSVGGIIARYLQELNGAITIGEETGTRYEGFVAGSAQYTTLKHSAIRIGVPCYLKEFPSSSVQNTSNRGLLPQHEVVVSLADRLEKRDPVMDFALDLIQKNKQ
ncbi:MAG: S41 family peptidase [Bacteroidota bacterium]